MTSQYLDQDIRSDEGFRSRAYPDPVSGAEPWTVGFGSTGPGIGPSTVWSLVQATQAQVAHRQQCEAQLDHALPWWRQLNDARQDVLVNWTYNMGLGHVLEFHNALGDVERSDWIDAAAEMVSSLWAKQVGDRAKRLAAQMRLGVRIAPGSPLPTSAPNEPSPIDQLKSAIGAA